MTGTNQFERDLNDTSFLGRPGRVDMVVFQNTADAGDGSPGLQRCFRNYLHEGGMEKDLNLVGYSIIGGGGVNVTNGILQQLTKITAEISVEQWSIVGGANQPVKQADSPTFDGLTLTKSLTVNGSMTITGDVDGVDVSGLKSAFDTHKGSTGADHTYIDQSVKQADSPTFVGLTLSGNVITTSTFDGVDVSAISLNNMPTAASADISANTQKIINVVDPVDNQDAATKVYIDTKTAIGCIMMFSGSWTDNVTIPGWYKCDGNNGTVNLIDKFVRGGAASGAEGGDDDAVVVSHSHEIYTDGAGAVHERLDSGYANSGQRTDGNVIKSTGVSGVGANIPIFYTLLFIQRIA